MRNNIKANSYYNIPSCTHEMNPLIKIICSIIFIVILFMARTLWLNAILLVILFLNILISNIPLKVYFNVFKRSLLFAFIIFLILLLFKVSIISSLIVFVKIIEVILSIAIILVTTKPLKIVKSFSKMFIPLKFIGINIYRLSYIILAVLEFIPRLFEVSKVINKSQRSKGVFGIIKSLRYKTIPLLVLTYDNQKSLYDGLTLKLYNVNCYKNENMKFKINMYDIAMLVFYVFILILTIGEEVGLCVF